MAFGSRVTRKIFFCAIPLLCTIAAHAQATPDAAMQTFMEGFNTGDMAKAASVNSPAGTSIIDEFAPYTWNGVKAFDEWGAGFEANAKVLGLTESKVSLGAPIVKNKTDIQAYYIYPSVYTYKQKGTPMREAAHIAVALRREGSAWKVAAWTWTGTVPKPVR